MTSSSASVEGRLALVVEMLETAARELREAIEEQKQTLPAEGDQNTEGDRDGR